MLFHATRPLLSETVIKGGTAYSALSEQTVAGKGVEAYTVIDTTALAGTGADQPGTYSTFTFTNTVPASSGVSGGYSGQWLTWNFPRLGHVTAPPGGVGAGNSLNGTPQFLGTFQYGDPSQDNTPWFLDFIQIGASDVIAPNFWWLSPTVPAITGSTVDSSGITTRMGFLWQTVLSGGGTVPAVPSVATDWGTVTSAKLNGMGSALTLLNSPPSLRTSSNTGQSIPASTRTVIQLPTVQLDNYAGWSTATSTYTAPLPGLYLFSNQVQWGTATSAGVRWSGLNVTAGGSTVVWQGPAYQAVPVGPGVSGVGMTGTAQARILALNPGDKVQAIAAQDSGITVATFNAPRLIGAYMTPQAAAGTVLSYTPPVTGFRFRAGALAGAALTAALDARIGNDVNFLLHRPYFTGYQSVAADRVPQHGGLPPDHHRHCGRAPAGRERRQLRRLVGIEPLVRVAGPRLVSRHGRPVCRRTRLPALRESSPPGSSAHPPAASPRQPPRTTTSRCTTRPRTRSRPARSPWARTTWLKASTCTRCSAPPPGAARGGRRSAPGQPGPSIRNSAFSGARVSSVIYPAQGGDWPQRARHRKRGACSGGRPPGS